MPAPATTRRTPCAALPRLLALRADVRVAAPSRSGKGNSNSSHQRPPGAAQVCVVRARGVRACARRLQARALDSMRARGRCARTQAPAVAGSSVLGEVPPNRVDKLPVILYRALQPPDMDQVCGVAPGIAPQPSRRTRLDIR